MPELTEAAKLLINGLVPNLYRVWDHHLQRVEALAEREKGIVKISSPCFYNACQRRLAALVKFMHDLHVGDAAAFEKKELNQDYFNEMLAESSGGARAHAGGASQHWALFEDSDKQVIACIVCARVLLSHQGALKDDTLPHGYEVFLNLESDSYAPGFCIDMPETSMALRDVLIQALSVTKESDLKDLSEKIKTYYTLGVFEKIAFSAMRVLVRASNSPEVIIARNLIEMYHENEMIKHFVGQLDMPKGSAAQVKVIKDELDKGVSGRDALCAFSSKHLSDPKFTMKALNLSAGNCFLGLDDRIVIFAKGSGFLQPFITIFDFNTVHKTSYTTEIQRNRIFSCLSVSSSDNLTSLWLDFCEVVRLDQLGHGHQFDHDSSAKLVTDPMVFPGYDRKHADEFRGDVCRFVRGLLTQIDRYLGESRAATKKKDLLKALQPELRKKLVLLSMPVAEILDHYKGIYRTYLGITNEKAEYPKLLDQVNKTFGCIYSHDCLPEETAGFTGTRADQFTHDLVRDLSLAGTMLNLFKVIWISNMSHKKLLAESQATTFPLSSGRVGEMHWGWIGGFMELFKQIATTNDWVSELCVAKVQVRESFNLDRVADELRVFDCFRPSHSGGASVSVVSQDAAVASDAAAPVPVCVADIPHIDDLVGLFIDCLSSAAASYHDVENLVDAVEKASYFCSPDSGIIADQEKPLRYFMVRLLAKCKARGMDASKHSELSLKDFWVYKYFFWVCKNKDMVQKDSLEGTPLQVLFGRLIKPVLDDVMDPEVRRLTDRKLELKRSITGQIAEYKKDHESVFSGSESSGSGFVMSQKMMEIFEPLFVEQKSKTELPSSMSIHAYFAVQLSKIDVSQRIKAVNFIERLNKDVWEWGHLEKKFSEYAREFSMYLSILRQSIQQCAAIDSCSGIDTCLSAMDSVAFDVEAFERFLTDTIPGISLQSKASRHGLSRQTLFPPMKKSKSCSDISRLPDVAPVVSGEVADGAPNRCSSCP